MYKEYKTLKNRNKQMTFEQKMEIINIFISFIGIMATIITIYLGFNQINLTFKEQRFSNRLEFADNLMTEYILLSDYASKATLYLILEANGRAEELTNIDSNYPNYSAIHAEALEKIKGKIAAYGSAELVSLFFDSYNKVQLSIEKGEYDFETYKEYFYSMPLIASCIRFDLTGEIINPSVFYNSFMRELKLLEGAKGMEDFHEKMIINNDELVKKYKLSEDFIWKE